MTAVQLDPAEARLRLEDALEMLLSSEPVDIMDGLNGEVDPDLEYDDPQLLWPLLAVRLELLPGTEDEEDDAPELVAADDDDAAKVRASVEEFLASPHAAALPDREFAGQLATVLADEAMLVGRGPYGFGPLALAVSLDGETFSHVELSDQQLDQLAPVLTAWTHFTADARELPAKAHEIWAVQAPRLADQFRAAYLDEAAVAHRAECPDVVPVEKFEPGVRVDEQDLAEDLARLLAEATGSGVGSGLRADLDLDADSAADAENDEG